MKPARLLLLIAVAVASMPLHAQDPYYHRDRGLVTGGLLGAVAGGVIGDRNEETAAGVAIGAAVGILAGAAIGDSVDNDIAWRQAAQQRYLASQLAKAVTIEDAISMTQAGLSESVIATQIQTNGVASRPRADQLIMLSRCGVSDTVIRSLQTAPLATARPPAPPQSSPVIVRRQHYVAPPPCVAYPWPQYYHPYAPPHPPHSSVHWRFSFGH